jgi:pyridoxine kinase
MKRIVSIQDISCIGKCSQTVALPILSSMGIETAILPTSVLSTHTAFNEFTFKNLTDELYKIAEHWKKEKFQFDLIYIGYTGSEEILNFVLDFIKQFKTDKNIVVFDPAMADHGRMYAGIDKNIFSKIKEVAKKADVIRLNLTEATFLLDMKYKENFTLEEGKDIAKRLQQLGGKITVITGIEKENEIGAIGYDGNKFYSNFETKYNKSYHGTGDIFTSALVGSILREKNLEESIKIATKFTTECVRTTYEDENGIEYGVNFELVIPYLLELL